MTASKKAPQTPEHFRDSWPYFWINRITAYYTLALEKRLKPLGIDVPRWRVMISLYQQDYLSISEVADFATLKLNTTTKIVQRMLADDLLTRRVRPNDGRVTEVCLTEKGDRLRARALIEVERIGTESFHNITPAERATLNHVLARISGDLQKLI
ncbi:MarR family winged helix-turn-helix transcriptional regulator [Celeribacter neptunius]|uniref:DNA-binding transcriptional regulator, MarR family n=1 Tax=Celeribacter neptunius TaxID=588602 RepID=A0A1I3LSK2_9RHOB|nr:MarR family transcriptional regulator [Celeribacter neptunius]SFI87510.1 DNA-binding transcriptional regulator, MarR family [Celeribacter neptunius]